MSTAGTKGKVSSASRKAYWLSRSDGKAEDRNRQRRLARHLRMHPHDAPAVAAIKDTRMSSALLGAVLHPMWGQQSDERAMKRAAKREKKRRAA